MTGITAFYQEASKRGVRVQVVMSEHDDAYRAGQQAWATGETNPYQQDLDHEAWEMGYAAEYERNS